MNGDVLANRVRLILRDTQSPADQGLFWSDMEIALALNNAQAIFVNASLRLGLSYLLAGLNVTTGFVTPLLQDGYHYQTTICIMFQQWLELISFRL